MTKSIRIKNLNGNKATIWPVGVHHYSVKWDSEQVTHTIANSDEELKEILQAIRVLKKYEGV